MPCRAELGTTGYFRSATGMAGAATIEAWMKMTGVSGSGAPWIGNDKMTAANQWWGIYFASGKVFVSDTANTVKSYLQHPPPTDGNWHHIAFVNSLIYVDGTTYAKSIPYEAAADMWIGNYPSRTWNTASGSVQVMDFRAWNKKTVSCSAPGRHV